MVDVSYSHHFDYTYNADGYLGPQLHFVLCSVDGPLRVADVEASVDSGAQRTLFDGRLGVALGIDILTGPQMTFSTASGGLVSATCHTVRLIHEALGAFELEVCFSTSEIRRNLLGRDFFDLVQIGFREHQMSFFVEPSP